MQPTHIIWSGAGRPAPFDSDGKHVVKHPITDVCSHCGDPHAEYRLKDAISDNFTTVKNASRAWPHKTDRLCAACIFAIKSLALKCSLWFARENGIWFVSVRPLTGFADTRPDVLDVLLNPPEPPFVAGFGLYGVDHGGEANLHRCWWPDGHNRSNILLNLQSKHTALYAEISTSRKVYSLQVDDVGDCTVDVDKWREYKAKAECCLREMRLAGMGANDARRALETMQLTSKAPFSLHCRWKKMSEWLRPVHGAPWWPMFVGLLIMPELTIKEDKTHGKRSNERKQLDTGRRRADSGGRVGDTANETTVCVPTTSDSTSDPPRRDRPKQVQQSLF
jgi:hypothetical protein